MLALSSAPRRIGFLAFDGVTAIDLAGALDAFHVAGEGALAPARPYQTLVIGFDRGPVVTESGLRLIPDVGAPEAPPLDTLIIPGGPGLRSEAAPAAAGFILSRAGQTRRIVSICTGLYGLAATGLLDGRRATTHWRHAAHAARLFPRVRLEPDLLFIKDGRFYTSAGMTAGIDLALALIEEDHGSALALATARQLVVYVKRAGGQLQYSEPLRSQVQGGDRFAELMRRLAVELSAGWTVERMAGEAGLSSRQFTRRFKAAFGMTPAAHLEALRLDEARLRLASSREAIARVAHAVGFSSDDAFRRAFERRFGLAPGAYRARFTPSPQEPFDDAGLRH